MPSTQIIKINYKQAVTKNMPLCKTGTGAPVPVPCLGYYFAIFPLVFSINRSARTTTRLCMPSPILSQ